MSFRSNGYVAHGGGGAERADPTYRNEVILFGRIAATDQNGRQRVDGSPGFPTLFHISEELTDFYFFFGYRPFAIMASYLDIDFVGYMKYGFHRFVVRDAFGIPAADNTMHDVR